MSKRGWIGVDLDGTLAQYDNWVSPDRIGDPIPLMVARVKGWLGQGVEVRIMTARAWNAPQEVIDCIQDWTEKHIGHRLPVTCTKEDGMIQLWDDRAVGVVPNSGLRAESVLHAALKRHHEWHQEDGLEMKLGDVYFDCASAYCDSSLEEETTAALAGYQP